MPDPDYSTVSGDTLDSWNVLADKVREKLAEAGLPILEEETVINIGGVAVEVDTGDDDAGGVFVHWEPSPSLADLAADAVAAGSFSHPAIGHSGVVAEAMCDAMASILRSSRIDAVKSTDDLRPFTLYVTASQM